MGSLRGTPHTTYLDECLSYTPHVVSNHTLHSHFGFGMQSSPSRRPSRAMGPFPDRSRGRPLFEEAEKSANSKASRPSSSSRKRLQKRDTEEQVERSLKTHFSGWSTLEVDGFKVEGKTLRQQLTEDRSAVNEGTRRLGSSYWKTMQAKYGGPSRPSNTLQVTNPNEHVSQALLECIESSTHNNTTLKSRAPFVQYFASVSNVNQKEYVGVLRHMMEIRPSASVASASFFVDFMKFVVRLALHTKYPEETEKLKRLMDEATREIKWQPYIDS
jgi:hypothetical protein